MMLYQITEEQLNSNNTTFVQNIREALPSNHSINSLTFETTKSQDFLLAVAKITYDDTSYMLLVNGSSTKGFRYRSAVSQGGYLLNTSIQYGNDLDIIKDSTKAIKASMKNLNKNLDYYSNTSLSTLEFSKFLGKLFFFDGLLMASQLSELQKVLNNSDFYKAKDFLKILIKACSNTHPKQKFEQLKDLTKAFNKEFLNYSLGVEDALPGQVDLLDSIAEVEAEASLKLSAEPLSNVAVATDLEEPSIENKEVVHSNIAVNSEELNLEDDSFIEDVPEEEVVVEETIVEEEAVPEAEAVVEDAVINLEEEFEEETEQAEVEEDTPSVAIAIINELRSSNDLDEISEIEAHEMYGSATKSEIEFKIIAEAAPAVQNLVSEDAFDDLEELDDSDDILDDDFEL